MSRPSDLCRAPDVDLPSKHEEACAIDQSEPTASGISAGGKTSVPDMWFGGSHWTAMESFHAVRSLKF